MAGQSAQNSKEIITSPSKKRTLSIVGVVFVVLVILALSGYFVKQTSTDSEGNSNTMTEAQKQTTVSTQDGDITIREGELPKDFPEDVAIYENSKVKRSTESSSSTTVILQTSDSVSKVTSFYNDNLKKNDWKSIQSSTIEGSSLITAEKDVRQLIITVVINEKDGRTEISLIVGTSK